MRVPTYFLIAVFAGWLNRRQRSMIECLKIEDGILKAQLRGRRPRLTDAQCQQPHFKRARSNGDKIATARCDI